MSAQPVAGAAVKLPLAIRKDVRDNESKKNALLADATATVGSPVTFNFDLDQVYANLATSSYQSRIVPVSLNYLDNVTGALRNTYKDELVKAEFDSAWTTHNIALAVVTSDAEWEALKADASTVGSSYFRLRLLNGELQVTSSVKYFNSNLSDISSLNLTPLAAAASAQSANNTPGAAEELPLPIRVAMRDVQVKVDAALSNIRQLGGLSDASFEVDKQTRHCYQQLGHNKANSVTFTPADLPRYLNELHALLVRQWKDEMVSEALLEEWRPPHVIELRPETDLEAETGGKVEKDGRYNAIKLDQGKLLMLQGKGMWMTNMHNIQTIDIVKML